MMRGYLKIITLKALDEGPKTGYALIKTIEEQTGHKPSFGSIYPLLENLSKEKLAIFKEKGNKKVYSLTKNGEEQLKCLNDKKQEMMDKMEESMKIFEMIHGQSLGLYQKKMMEKIKKEKMDLTQILPPEVMNMKEIWAKLIVEDKLKNHKKEISKILKEANTKLLKIK